MADLYQPKVPCHIQEIMHPNKAWNLKITLDSVTFPGKSASSGLLVNFRYCLVGDFNPPLNNISLKRESSPSSAGK